MVLTSPEGTLQERVTRRVFVVGIVAALLQLAITNDVVRALFSFVINASVAGLIVYGIKRNRPERSAQWWLISGGMALLAVSNLAWAAEFAEMFPDWTDMAMNGPKLLASFAFSAAVALFVSRWSDDRRIDTVIDVTLIMAGIALILWQWAMLATTSQNTVFDQPATRTLLIAGVVVTMVFMGVRLFTRWAGALSMVALLAAGGLAVVAQAVLTFSEPGQAPRWSDVLWLSSAVLVAVAAVHPSMAVHLPVTQPWRAAPRLITAGALLLANPVFVWLHLLQDSASRNTILALAALVAALTLIGLWRLGALMIDLEQARAAVSDSEQRFRSLVQHASDVTVVLDRDAKVTYASPSAAKVLGYDPQLLVGQNLADHINPEDVDSFRRFLSSCVERPGSERITPDVRIRNSTGRYRATEMVASNLSDDPGISGIVVTIRDITDRVAFETQLRHMASHDDLTGLANRVLFSDRVSHGLARNARQRSEMAVIFIDLDDFKTINDSLGHLAGDELLRIVADRLEASLRAADTAARLGGDEFGILLEDLAEPDDALVTVDRILAAFRLPIMLEERPVTVSAALGIAFSAPGTTTEDLLRNADTAMFRAKAAGKGRYELFEPEMHQAARSRFDLKSDLEGALDRKEFVLHYQPIFDLEKESIVGLEALLRWQHPKRGLVMPDAFIPLLEETGLIVQVGRWVVHEACRMAGIWQQLGSEGKQLAMSVNLSVKQFRHPDLIRDVSVALRNAGISASDLIMEITESVFLGDTDAALLQLDRLRELGVRLAIDDFGTGYSALSYLQRFRADIVKVDKSFVSTLDADDSERALTQGIVTLAKALGIRTVAEGVEREAQVTDLRDMECPFAQGFFFTKALPEGEIAELLAGHPSASGGELTSAR
ncbi:MAG: EAL domain-containing protein [Acidimicrobiia bacterium]|nr:EAL domain-containing protein [Acidimicrobiia bacterium]